MALETFPYSNSKHNESDQDMNQEKKEQKKPVIGITCGDLNGIGIEVILKSLRDARISNILTPVILCSSKTISFYKKALDMEEFNFFQTESIEKINLKRTNILNLWDEKVDIIPGEASRENGKYTRISLAKGVELLKAGSIEGLVTAPLNKELVQDESFEFPGHTEYLAHAFGQEDSLMFMVHESLRIGVVTGHIPVSQVSETVTTAAIFGKAKIMIKSLQKDFGIKKPRIAVLGLNPHAGENGLLGEEEGEKINPAIAQLKDQGHLVYGPFSADGFFGSSQFANFDGILAMYHDQGLIPFKQFSFGAGVNFTAGLAGVRTSPDHGTAFNLAGKNSFFEVLGLLWLRIFIDRFLVLGLSYSWEGVLFLCVHKFPFFYEHSSDDS